MAGAANKKSVKASEKRVQDKKDMQKHLDSVFVVPKPKVDGLSEKRFEDDFDDIFEWFTSNKKKELSEVQKRQLERWNFARECSKDDAFYRNFDVANALVTQFDISIQQAYRDIKNSKYLYKYLEPVEYEFEKIMHIERIKRHIKLAELLGDKGVNALAKLNHELTIVFGFDREKDEMPQPIDIHINVMDNPELVGGKRIPNLQSQIDGVLQKALAEKIANAEEINFDNV